VKREMTGSVKRVCVGVGESVQREKMEMIAIIIAEEGSKINEEEREKGLSKSKGAKNKGRG